MSEENTSPKKNTRPDEDLLLDLNFVPQWAKKAPGANHYAAEERRPARRSPHDRRDPPAGQRSRRRPVRSSSDERPVRRPLRRPDERPDERPLRREESRAPQPEFIELPVEIKFLPDQKMLSSMVRQIHHSKRAYPLMDLANLFLSDPKGHHVKIEVMAGAEGFKLYQGKRSKMVSTDREVLLQQIIDDHLEDFFIKEEVQVDPPTGVFPMIGKIDDVLIGPPNHHSYSDRLAEIHRTRYAGLSFDRFKAKVQTVRDEELVEQWKQEASEKTVYRLKDAPEGESKEFSLTEAQEYIRLHLAETEIEEVTRAVIPSSLARKIKDYNLIRMVREAWQAESRFPISLSFSLRAAFRHLHLQIFKTGKNINFVTSVKPDPISPAATAENIRAVLEYLTEHPGSTREQLVRGLRPDAAKDSPEAHEILNPIRWLVEKGHLIEFFNGTFSVPSRRRR
ncbi:MAG: hypothetical protein PWQ29_14 [Verrucomicrobiota bacterium]|jgi:hypothetical protein|nr:hypothetical protein [Verrucomicrobiota bacterium]MDK2962620.1 hypothetical protein [Verrucomicrobiota bacterium]